jgi:hypothetical protein
VNLALFTAKPTWGMKAQCGFKTWEFNLSNHSTGQVPVKNIKVNY